MFSFIKNNKNKSNNDLIPPLESQYSTQATLSQNISQFEEEDNNDDNIKDKKIKQPKIKINLTIRDYLEEFFKNEEEELLNEEEFFIQSQEAGQIPLPKNLFRKFEGKDFSDDEEEEQTTKKKKKKLIRNNVLSILPTIDGKYAVRVCNCMPIKRPVVNSYEDALLIRDWYRELDFTGVIEEEQNELYSVFYVNKTGELIYLKHKTFPSIQQAAAYHDYLHYKFKLTYVRNVGRRHKQHIRVHRFVNIHTNYTKFSIAQARYRQLYYHLRLLRLLLLKSSLESKKWMIMNQMLHFCTLFTSNAFTINITSFRQRLTCYFEISSCLQLCYQVGVFKLLSNHQEKLKWINGILELTNKILKPINFAKFNLKYQTKIQEMFGWLIKDMYYYKIQITPNNLEEFQLIETKLAEMKQEIPAWSNYHHVDQLLGEVLLEVGKETYDFSKLNDARDVFISLLNKNKRSMVCLTQVQVEIYLLQKSMNSSILPFASLLTQSLLSISNELEKEEQENDEDLEQELPGSIDCIKIMKKNKDNKNSTHLFAWDLLLNYNPTKNQLILNEQRLLLTQQIRFDPTITGDCIQNLTLLWAIITNKLIKQELYFIEFFHLVSDCLECLTQKEMPSYGNYYSNQSTKLWEYLLVSEHLIINKQTIEFDFNKRLFWKHRFFPSFINYYQDPFDFFNNLIYYKRISRVFKITRITSQCPDQYLYSIKALIGLKFNITSEYYNMLVEYYGGHYMDVLVVNQAFQNCYQHVI
jgi:hypothetical protein